jgi:hypothetical protein
MAEQTFRSPGFFEREIDLTERDSAPSGTPAGIIGTAETGPAFVPVTVGSFSDFVARFGDLSSERFAPYAVNEWFKNRSALTFLRVLGAGANNSISDINKTQQYGVVKNAGFVLSGGVDDGKGSGVESGFVQFLVADHAVSPASSNSFPIFNNRSVPDFFNPDTRVNLVRGIVFFASGSRGYLTGTNEPLDEARINANTQPFSENAQQFKIVISSSDGAAFSTQDTISGIRVFTCSLNPNSVNYYGKVLNTDPLKFQEAQHLLYADFAVDTELASGSIGSAGDARVGLVTGISNTGPTAANNLLRHDAGTGVHFRELFGRFDTRYKAARTTSFISQPFGEKEFDLFHFEAITDGAYPNSRYKVSIANLKASTDPNNPYGTFEVQVRAFNDTDTNPQILEAFPDVNLNPQSDRFVAKIIGDRKVTFNHDAEILEERRLTVSGKYGNRSRYVRVVLNASLETGDVPGTALPFGFRGIPVIKTSDSLTELVDRPIVDTAGNTIGQAVPRLSLAGTDVSITGSIVPPLPFRFTVTRGPMAATISGDIGTLGTTTRPDKRFYWGVQNTSLPNGSVLDPNVGSTLNPLINAYTKFQGIEKIDALVTGSGADAFNDNKFTLARVALSASSPADITLSADEHMKFAVYVRSAVPLGANYTVTAGGGNRVTLATLINSSSTVFNRFTPYNKFTNIMYGGFDGLNILDKETVFMKDRSAATDEGGYAVDELSKLGLVSGGNGKQSGAGIENNAIASFRTAIEIMTDPFAVKTNLLAIPGIRDAFITDYAADKTRAYSLATYLMDIPSYAVDNIGNAKRLYRDVEDLRGTRPDAAETAEQFDSRAIDNNYVATYFPDVVIVDERSGRSIEVPSSIAALGALGFNDRVSYPWFAPAGFNRGSLLFVSNTATRLLQEDRDTLYSVRINPIANFPIESSSRQQFVIFGQKTLQQGQSALDRVNIRRLLIEIKRLISDVATGLLFESNDDTTRATFKNRINPILATIAAQQGIEQFNVICDSSNNSQADVELNRMNGRIIIVPTRVIEFVAIDFIVTNSGVSFE